MDAMTSEAPDSSAEQLRVRCVLMRGGTSKALFFHEADVPPPGPQRDRFLKRAMGTPDVLQIDGMGGSRLVTSKVAIIKRSERPDADVDYTFAQIDVERDGINNNANCGNISSAVAPFSIDEGLVEAVAPLTTVRIYNTNTGKILVSKVQVAGGKARIHGACAIPGVPGTGAEILMDFAGTVGAMSGKLLPTGNVVDTITMEDGRRVEVTICDAANPCVFVNAADIGMSGSETMLEITGNRPLIETIGEIQSKAGQMMGMWPDWRQEHLPALPCALIVAAPADYTDVNGTLHPAATMDARERFIFLGRCHESMAGAGSMCSAAASRIPGSVLNKVVDPRSLSGGTLRIGHPLGVMHVRVDVDPQAQAPHLRFSTLSFPRTARRLMDGFIYVPA